MNTMRRKSKTRFAVLGLLSWQPMSGYQIKKMIEMGLSHFWAESYGQLYPTLDKLVHDGLATRSSGATGKRKKHLFRITEAGRVCFLEWLAEPTEQPRMRNEFQLKFFLAGDLPVEHGLSLLADYKTQQEDIAQTYAESERILSTALNHGEVVEDLDRVLGATSRQQIMFFLISLRHGVLAVNARIAWCKESIAELKKEQKKRRKKSD